MCTFPKALVETLNNTYVYMHLFDVTFDLTDAHKVD